MPSGHGICCTWCLQRANQVGMAHHSRRLRLHLGNAFRPSYERGAEQSQKLWFERKARRSPQPSATAGDRTSRLHRSCALVNEVILNLVSKPPVVVTARPLSDVDYGRVLEYALLYTRRRSSNQQCGGPSRRGGQHCRTHRLARRHSRSSDRVGALPVASSSASLV